MENGTAIVEFLKSDAGAARFALARQNGKSLSTVKYATPGEDKDGDEEAIAAAFWERATDFANLGESERFLVVSYDDAGKVREQFPFRIGAPAAELSSLELRDDPSMQGNAKAWMRSLGVRDRATQKALQLSLGTLERELRQKEKRIYELEIQLAKILDKHFRFIELLEQTKSEQHDRRLKQIEAEAQAETRAIVLKTMKPLADIWLGKMSGSTDVGALVESLAPEQWDTMREMLTDKQKPLLEVVLQTAAKAKKGKRTLGRAGRVSKAKPAQLEEGNAGKAT